jgi:hypothetical protein
VLVHVFVHVIMCVVMCVCVCVCVCVCACVVRCDHGQCGDKQRGHWERMHHYEAGNRHEEGGRQEQDKGSGGLAATTNLLRLSDTQPAVLALLNTRKRVHHLPIHMGGT